MGATFTFGGNFGGAKLILVAKVIGDLVVVDVLTTSPLVIFVVPFVIPLLNGFFGGAVLGRLKGFGEPLVSVCLLINVDVRGVVLVFGVVDDFVITVVFEVMGLLVDVAVVLVKEVRGVVGVVLAEIGRDGGIVVLGTVFGGAFAVVVGVVFKVVVFGAVVGRILAVGLVVDGAVNGLDIGLDVVVDAVVFLRIVVDVFEDNGFVGEVFVVVVLTLEVVVSTFLGADFLVVKLTPVTAAIAAVPTAAAIATSAT